MKRIHIVGRKNSGKTTMVVELVEYFVGQGFKVGTVKHTHHRHELDTPGKDSHRHRQAGAVVTGILSPELNAVFFPPRSAHDAADRYDEMASMFADCDLVVVEGHSKTDGPKVEVWRAENGTDPMALDDGSILAVITDDPLSLAVPVLPRQDVAGVAEQLRKWAR